MELDVLAESGVASHIIMLPLRTITQASEGPPTSICESPKPKATQSRLETLPFELRRQIFHYILPSESINCCKGSLILGHKWHFFPNTDARAAFRECLSLRRVCRFFNEDMIIKSQLTVTANFFTWQNLREFSTDFPLITRHVVDTIKVIWFKPGDFSDAGDSLAAFEALRTITITITTGSSSNDAVEPAPRLRDMDSLPEPTVLLLDRIRAQQPKLAPIMRMSSHLRLGERPKGRRGQHWKAGQVVDLDAEIKRIFDISEHVGIGSRDQSGDSQENRSPVLSSGQR